MEGEQARTVSWLAVSEAGLPASEGWLTPVELDRAARSEFAKVRQEYLLRRWAGKLAVTAVLGLDRSAAALRRVEIGNRTGEPPFALVDGRRASVSLSMTDRAGWAVGAIVADLGHREGVDAEAPNDVALGCDMELVEPRSPGFVADFLTGTEQAYVASRPPGDRDAVTNVVWSAKESALKALGTGLGRDTREVEVRLDDTSDLSPAGWWSGHVTTPEGTVMPLWWSRHGSFVVTLAATVRTEPPTLLPGSADLVSARPAHTWMQRPRLG